MWVWIGGPIVGLLLLFFLYLLTFGPHRKLASGECVGNGACAFEFTPPRSRRYRVWARVECAGIRSCPLIELRAMNRGAVVMSERHSDLHQKAKWYVHGSTFTVKLGKTPRLEAGQTYQFDARNFEPRLRNMRVFVST